MNFDHIQPGRFYRVGNGHDSYLVEAVAPAKSHPNTWVCRHAGGNLSLVSAKFFLFERAEQLPPENGRPQHHSG